MNGQVALDDHVTGKNFRQSDLCRQGCTRDQGKQKKRSQIHQYPYESGMAETVQRRIAGGRFPDIMLPEDASVLQVPAGETVGPTAEQ
jgi:hypothetical protein